MPNNPDIKFRKKIYDSLTDNVDGVITFDSESKRIYLDGDAYGNVQSDWQQIGSDQPDYVKHRTHYIDYDTIVANVDVAENQEEFSFPVENVIAFSYSTSINQDLKAYYECIGGNDLDRAVGTLKILKSMTIGAQTVFSDGVDIHYMPEVVPEISGLPVGGNVKVYLDYAVSQGESIDVDPDDYDTGEDFAFIPFFGLLFLTDNASYGLDGVNTPSVSLMLDVPRIVQLPLPYIPDIPASKVTGLYLNTMQDVEIGTVEDGQILTYNTSLGRWENADLEIGSIPEMLDDLDDVTIGTGPTDGDFLLYIGTDSQWENVTPSIVEIDETDTDIYENALQDYDGNRYPAAIIGSQVWMVGNLRTEHYMDGTALTYGDDYTTAEGSVTYPGKSTDNISEYGALYNGAAILSGGTSGSKGGTKSASQTLLPDGWRIPTEDDLEQLYEAMQYEAPKSGDTKAASAYNTNELYSTRFNPQYAGYVEGVTSGSGPKATTGRSNAYDFGTKLWVWSSTDVGKKSDEKGGTKSGSDNLYAFSAKKYEDGGTIKGSNTALSDSKGYIQMAQADKGDFLSVRGVYEGTPEEFIEEYKRAHGGGGEPTAEGKFLKNLGDNQLAWSDISWNDLKERPFGEICSETRETVTLNYNLVGDEGTNPSGGVSFGYVTSSDLDTIPTKAIINGTVEVELSSGVSEYGNANYLMDIFSNGSTSSADTGEDWGLIIRNGDFGVLRRLESGGTDMPTLELFYDDCTIKKLDNQYLDLADVAFSGSYSDLTDTPEGVELYEPIPYLNLVDRIRNNGLVEGQQYRITDYVTTTVQTDTQSANHQFDLVVTATSDSTIDCKASAVLHSGDTYFSASGNTCDLSKWEIWYDINNDTSKYAWADDTNGKGVIYRMVDDYGNDFPYDFKNIQFKRKLTDGAYDPENGTDTWVYTFNKYSTTDLSSKDGSLVFDVNQFSVCALNTMKAGFSGPYSLTDTVFLGVDGILIAFNAFGFSCGNNTFGFYILDNIFGDGFDSNVIGNNFMFNTFGNSCGSNEFGQGASYNDFGNSCSMNVFGSDCARNKFGNTCQSNRFSYGCSYNTFGTHCQSNQFGENCSYNAFGNDCTNNTFDDSCSHNTLGNECEGNTFGDICCNNSLENNCSSVIFGDGYGNYGDYVQNVVVRNGCANIKLYKSGTADSSNYLQNIYIAQGVHDAVISSISRNLPYRTTVGMTTPDAGMSVGTLRIYNEDDPVSIPTLATVATTGNYSDLTGTPTLSTVATTGNYSDLTGTPTLSTVATTGNYSDLTGTPTLSTVATTGNYSDLTGTPTIGSGVLTLEMNGTTLGTFSANDTQNKTFSLTASSSLSQLTDVTIGTLADSQTLIYDSTSGKWVNEQTVRTFTFAQNEAPTQIPEAIAAFQNGSYVKFRLGTDSSEWYDMESYNTQSQSITGAKLSYDSDNGLMKIEYTGTLNPVVPGIYWIGHAVGVKLDNLDDVQIGTLADGQILQYDSSSQRWRNVANSGGASIVIREWTNS